MRIKAEASNFIDGRWDLQTKEYEYKGDNRKAALTWALKKLHKDCPGFKSHSATIVDAHSHHNPER